jgi:cell division protein FtsI (penicillin-binding protein 3)
MRSRKDSLYSKGRLSVLFILISLGWLLVILRLVNIQIAHGQEYKLKASKQSTGRVTVKADRGLLFDRKGRQIALNVVKNSLYAYPSSRREISRINGYLDKKYNRKRGTSARKYSMKPSRFTWIDRSISDNLARQIKRDSLPGLYFKEEIRREYPFGRVGRQLLGAADIDGRGISGLEYYHDSILAGTPGLTDYLRDARRNTYRISEIPLIKSRPGRSIVLTIDWQFQEIVEEELKAAVAKYNASEGSAIFLDCRSGEILAAADYSTEGQNSSIKLKAVSNSFEPGSVFKVFTYAALLDKSLLEIDEKLYCENGIWKCQGGRMRDDKKHDTLDIRRIFELSSNIGVGKLALRLGHEELIETARRFGFGVKTMVELPGEQSGMIGDPGVWSEYSVSALSIGHAISATPLQLAAAVAAVANSGRLIRPTIIKGIINHEGKLLKKNRPEYIGRVAEKSTINILHDFMKGVVDSGTAIPAKSIITSIAGKTGTAEIVDFENGGYIKNKFNASFMGFFPAEEPQIAGIVVLNKPHPVTYGGHTAGPAFKNMAERYAMANPALMGGGNMLAENDDFDIKKVPDFTGKDLSLAQQIAEKKGFNLVCNSDEGVVVWQYPPEDRNIFGNESVAILVENDGEEKVMFDFRGMKMRTAMAVLFQQGLTPKISGHGKVRKQYPSAGKKLTTRAECRLVCGS